MPTTLLDSFHRLLTPERLGSLAGRLNEPESDLSRSLTAAAGSILLGMLSRAENRVAMRELRRLTSETPEEAWSSDESLGRLLIGRTSALTAAANPFLSLALGDKLPATADAVGRSSGIKAGSALAVLTLVGPVMLGLVARRAHMDHLHADDLGPLLLGESDSIQRAAPADLPGSLAMPGTAPAPGARRTTVTSGDHEYPGSGWLWLAVAAAVILGMVWFASRAGSHGEGATALHQAARPPADSGDVLAYSPRAAPIVLPDGTTLPASGGTLERQLLSTIQDSAVTAAPGAWFEFDRVAFEPASATFVPEAEPQLRNVAAILASYPNVTAVISGGGDSATAGASGLARRRAESVVNQLVAMGVSRSRLKVDASTAASPATQGGPAADSAGLHGAPLAIRILLE